ncbi:MAG: hypothetical protein FWD62_12680 [Betaproteobacteria bacterium]|nr:hypothetical protein [Betaproteobacteria bacterium]
MCRTFFLFLLALAAPQVWAQEETATRDEADLARAQALRDQASAAYSRIDHDRKTGEAECARKVLVNRCLDRLREDLNQRESAARKLNVEAGNLERAVKARGVAVRDAEREIKRPERAQEQAEQGAKFEAEQAEKERDLVHKQSEHDKALTEGPERARINQAERASKDAALAQKRVQDAQAAAKRAQQAREDAARYAEKRRKLDAKRAETPSPAASAVQPSVPLAE